MTPPRRHGTSSELALDSLAALLIRKPDLRAAIASGSTPEAFASELRSARLGVQDVILRAIEMAA